MNEEAHVDVAMTIYSQFGGNHSMAMISGTAVAATKEQNGTLRFKHMEGKTSEDKVINFTKISLNSMNEYDITFLHEQQGLYTEQKTLTGISADNLQQVFEDETGLALSL
jgi:hypothetical protein